MGPGVFSPALMVMTFLPALIGVAIAIFLIALAYRLVRAVESIAEKLK